MRSLRTGGVFGAGWRRLWPPRSAVRQVLPSPCGYSAARQHLEKSRGRLFGLHPDPSGAYDEVVRAVEAVACPLFLPNAQTPTLGTVLAHLRQSSAYEFVVPGKHGAPGASTRWSR